MSKSILTICLLFVVSLMGLLYVLIIQKCPTALHQNQEKQIHAVRAHSSETKDLQQKSSTQSIQVQNRIIENGWELIWVDDFNGIGVNTDYWTFEDWAAEKNNELQYYTPNNVTVEDGHLKIIAKKETFRGRQYTSGAIHTKDKFSFQYGKVEIRAKLPGGAGIFPAFWMMPNKDNTWLPEIDILELLGQNPKEIWMVVHWVDSNNKQQSDWKKYIGNDFTKEFHTYGIEWTPHYIAWFIDGQEKFRTTQYSPAEKMYLYLNTAIGGNWPGNPNKNTIFPNYFEIDYIKVFRKPGGPL